MRASISGLVLSECYQWGIFLIYRHGLTAEKWLVRPSLGGLLVSLILSFFLTVYLRLQSSFGILSTQILDDIFRYRVGQYALPRAKQSGFVSVRPTVCVLGQQKCCHRYPFISFVSWVKIKIQKSNLLLLCLIACS